MYIVIIAELSYPWQCFIYICRRWTRRVLLNRTFSCQNCCSQFKYVQIMKCYGQKIFKPPVFLQLAASKWIIKIKTIWNNQWELQQLFWLNLMLYKILDNVLDFVKGQKCNYHKMFLCILLTNIKYSQTCIKRSWPLRQEKSGLIRQVIP